MIMRRAVKRHERKLQIVTERVPLKDSTNIVMATIDKLAKRKPRLLKNDSQKPQIRKNNTKTNSKISSQKKLPNKDKPKIGFKEKPNTDIKNPEVVIEKSPELEDLLGHKSKKYVDNKSEIQTVKEQKIMNLRTHEHVNYRESSLGSSFNESRGAAKPKLPIYQQANMLESKKTSKDPYAFDFTDEKKKRDRQSSINDRTMHEILTKLEKKEKKKRIQNKKKIKKSPEKYDKNINNVLKRVMTKIKAKSAHSPEAQNVKNTTLPFNNSIIEKSVLSTSTTNNLCASPDFLGFDKQEQFFNKSLSYLEKYNSNVNISHSLSSQMNINENITSPNNRINIISNISICPNSSIQTSEIVLPPHHINSSHHLHTGTEKLLHHNTILSTSALDCDANLVQSFYSDSNCENDEYFGFKEDTESDKPKVYSLGKPRYLPWRFRGEVRRIPYLIKIKSNGLPCKDQEMVIDYEFVKRIENGCTKKKPVKNTPVKSNVQTSIRNFLESENVENFPRPSLFDYEEFHPPRQIKKVLGMIQDNHISSTPKKNCENIIQSPDVSIIELKDVKKRNLEKIMNEKGIHQYDKDNDKNKDKEDSLVDKSGLDADQVSVKLFEDCATENVDFSIKLPKMRYGTKKRRKEVEEEGDEESKPKKKKKNAMTKKEEAEYEAWIEKTNAEFAEVDKFDLTIE